MDRRAEYLRLKGEAPELLEKEVAGRLRIHPGTLSRLKRQWGLAETEGGDSSGDGNEVQTLATVRQEYQTALAVLSVVGTDGIAMDELDAVRMRLMAEVSVVALAERTARATMLGELYAKLHDALNGEAIVPEAVASLALAIKALR